MKPVNRIHLKANNTKDMLIDLLENAENIIKENANDHSTKIGQLDNKIAQANERVTAYENEVVRLKADRVKRQSAVDLGLYHLEAYRVVLADVHDNIKVNPEAHGS